MALTKPLPESNKSSGFSRAVNRSPLPSIPVVEMKKNKDVSNSILSYQKIKNDLLVPFSEETDGKKGRLLYALRQNLPKNSIHLRRNVLNEYITNDIFNIVSEKVNLLFKKQEYSNRNINDCIYSDKRTDGKIN